MDQPLYYAFYGSLRRGMDNYEFYRHHLVFIKELMLPGFKMYSLHDYPYAVHTANKEDTIAAELFFIGDRATEQTIHDMEIDAGYILLKQDIAEGKMGIYVFESARHGDAPVANGNWVTYRRTLGF